MNDSDSSKPILIPDSSKKIALEKEKVLKKISKEEEWKKMVDSLSNMSLASIVALLKSENKPKLLEKHIKDKLRGYVQQDKEKKIYAPEKFIDYLSVLDLFEKTEGQCHYCKESVLLLYDFVRDPKQWTLERKNNEHGHNKDNLLIACLNCNIKRKCMKIDKYILTKQLSKIEKMDHS